MSTNNSAAAVDDAVIQRTVQALSERNMPAVVAESGEHALQLLKDMIPEGAEVFNSTSETLDTIGYSDYLHNNPRYRNLHDEVAAETDPVKLREKRRLATVSEYIIGSVQAISETGEIVVANILALDFKITLFYKNRIYFWVGWLKAHASINFLVEPF